MRDAATQARPQRIVEERQRSRCPFPPRPVGLRPATPLASLLARYIPQRVCSSLAPRQRLCGPAANCSNYFAEAPKDNSGNIRPLIPRSFRSLSEAEEENGQSRIYLGIHWAFDKTEGITQGRRVADYVFRNKFVPLN